MSRRPSRGEGGQATTEVVLLFPLFLFFLFAFAKVFALLILVQKLEIASFYAARRWQLESHRNATYENSFDTPILQPDIQQHVCSYLGYGGASGGGCIPPSPDVELDWGNGQRSQTSAGNFLNLTSSCLQTSECTAGAPGVTIQRTQVWNVVTVTACTSPLNMPFYKTQGFVFCSTKYVPNRDRPIAFVLPGLNPGGP